MTEFESRLLERIADTLDCIDARLQAIYDQMPSKESEPSNPLDDPGYQALVEQLAKDCRCVGVDKPCDGLMGGGLCDKLNMSEGED